MERLTQNGKIKNLCENDMYCEMAESQVQLLESAINKLAEYENTGLEPSEVERLKHVLAVRDNDRFTVYHIKN